MVRISDYGIVPWLKEQQDYAEKYGGTISGKSSSHVPYSPEGGTQVYTQDPNRIWEEDYEPAIAEYAEASKTINQNALEREMARLRMRLGYNQSAGAGTAGWWNLARSNMLNAGAQKQMDIFTAQISIRTKEKNTKLKEDDRKRSEERDMP